MGAPSGSAFSFTKLVVDDLEKMADYYCEVFGLHRGRRDRFENGVGGEPIEEVALVANPEDRYSQLSLLEFPERPAVDQDEAILGFTTPDLASVVGRIERAGGTLVSGIKEFPEHGIRVVFARDPEGHLNEIVETRN